MESQTNEDYLKSIDTKLTHIEQKIDELKRLQESWYYKSQTLSHMRKYSDISNKDYYYIPRPPL